MRQTIWATLAVACLVAPLWVSAVGPAKGKATAVPSKAELLGNAEWGKEKADSERCIECHGADGHGAGHSNGTEGKFAKLAGQHPDYVLKQIRDFRSGARKHDQMAIMARSVSDEDVRDIAAWFASQSPMQPDGSAKGEALSLGKALYEQGDPARGIVSCASCHGAHGEGLPGQALIPVIRGQEWRYLDKQLRDWRAGDRRNGPDPLMNQVTRALSDKEIEALATYLSGM